jgi:enterochelin esterase-like enzyme
VIVRAAVALLGAFLLVSGCGAADPQGAQVKRFRLGGLQHVAVIPADAPAAGKRGMVVFLHYRGGRATDELDNEPFFRALAAAGSRAPVFVFPASNGHSYWHNRRERKWGRFVWRDVIPEAVRRYGIDERRIAVGGISMGGFGAFDMARLHPGRFCAAAGHSPAIWQSAGETAPGAFDDAADFGRHDIVRVARRRPSVFARTRHLWLDGGTADPFDPGMDAFAAALRRGGVPITVRRRPGGHTHDYWRAHWPAYVRFYARALSDCSG